VFELSQLPPPRRGAGAGYYPDPLGSGRARWWDGTAWTSTVGPKVEADAPLDRPLDPPTKVCPRCAVQSETFAPACPNCGRTYGRASAWQIIAIAVGSLVLLVGGCGACVALVDEELDRNAITDEEFDSVRRGTTRAEVEARFGEPFETFRDGRLDCVSYGDESGFLDLSFYDFCFRNGRLAYKDAY